MGEQRERVKEGKGRLTFWDLGGMRIIEWFWSGSV